MGDRQSHHTEEVQHMSADDKAKDYKTLAIRLDNDVHAQLQVIARLLDSSIADEIRQAIDAHLQAKRKDPELSKRASDVRDSIEHEAKLRQDAIASLFSEDTPASSGTSRGRRGKASGEDTSTS
jgi:hypothetical protein